MQEPITRLIHHPYRAPEGFEAYPPAVHKASTVLFKDLATMRSRNIHNRGGYTYGLHSTPTLYTLEERIAALEGGTYCALAPSGLAAITLVNVGLLQAGDEVLLPSNVYGPSKEQARNVLARWGIAHRLYDAMDVSSLQRAMGPATRLVWVEAPGSVTMEFPDLRGLVRVAKAAGATVALDNTWGAGLAFNAFEMGVDLSMQALTKYPSGGADVLMGSVVTRDEALHRRVADAHSALGMGVAANDIEFVLRALPSVEIRYDQADRTARGLARWLGEQPEVAQVLHPALPGAPGRAGCSTCATSGCSPSQRARPRAVRSAWS